MQQHAEFAGGHLVRTARREAVGESKNSFRAARSVRLALDVIKPDLKGPDDGFLQALAYDAREFGRKV
jgi:hypothetical protein